MNPTETDPLLLPYLTATEEEEAQRLMAALMAEHLEPVIRQAIRQKLALISRAQQDEMADVQSEIVLQLLHRLRQLRSENHRSAIKNLRAYAAVASQHGCAAYLRRCYPQRSKLLNRVRYLLVSQPQFVLWQDETEEWFGGLAAWERTQYRCLRSEHLQSLRSKALPAALVHIPDSSFTRQRPDAQLAALLQWAQGYVALDDLVAVLGHWWNIKDQTTDSLSETSDPRVDLETQIGQRLYLQKLWQEIVALPLRQRQALLLNLRDVGNQGVLMLLPALQIASLRDIAAVLELPVEEFALLWARLPLDDAEIAARLYVTRRQVINLRGAARERLSRRTKDW